VTTGTRQRARKEYGVDESHDQLVAAWFGPGDPVDTGPEFGISGYICDYSAPWNANCHDFSVVYEKAAGLVGFADTRGSSDYEWDEWFRIGKGSIVLHYYAPTAE